MVNSYIFTKIGLFLRILYMKKITFALLLFVVSSVSVVAQQKITLEASEEALNKLATDGYDPNYGGRPIKRVLQKAVLNELSKAILSGKIQKDSAVMMELDEKGELTFENIVVEV